MGAQHPGSSLLRTLGLRRGGRDAVPARERSATRSRADVETVSRAARLANSRHRTRLASARPPPAARSIPVVLSAGLAAERRELERWLAAPRVTTACATMLSCC